MGARLSVAAVGAWLLVAVYYFYQYALRSAPSVMMPQLTEALSIDAASLPIIWDADFLYGPRTESGEDSYVLCEINVSSCFAIPDQAPAAIAHLASKRLQSGRKM